MPRQTWLMDVLADEFRGVKGFRVDAYPGWQSRGNSIFDPTHVMDHHTGAGAYNNLLRYMAEGPVHPPLCNFASSRPYNGVVRITVVAAGRANHAGRGDYPTMPRDQANRYSLGGEHQNDGRQPWPAQQREAMRRIDAALLRRLGRSPAPHLLDHKTWAPGRKSDRHTINVNTERTAVQALLRTDPWEELLMSLNAEQRRALENMNPAMLERALILAGTLNSDNAASRIGEFGRAMAEDEEGGKKSGWGRSVFRSAVIEPHRRWHDLGVSRKEADEYVSGQVLGQKFMRPDEKFDMQTAGMRLVQASLAVWREAGPRGWVRSWQRFRENKPYTEDDLS